MTYPPQPWALCGQLHASAFLVPAADLPVDYLPGWRPVRVAGRLVVGAVWVTYEPAGVLSYSELMVTVLVRRGSRVQPHIVAIWVDSVASRDGGRALWAIPKELASFASANGSWMATTDDGAIASAVVRAGRPSPMALPVRFSVVQARDRAALVSPVRARARISRTAARWHAEPDGPLACLAGRQPFASFTLHDFRMSFGR